jgi:NAD(P)-dependent dehydrogenase (short-subunit alcohol dehydrogenase family)
MRLQGKIAIITGAASGIGFATALRFAGEAATVVLSDIVDVSQRTNALVENGYKATFVSVDVSKEKEVMRLVETTVREYGRLDILVNNAGIELAKKVTETAEEDWDRLMNVNLKGVFFCSKAAIMAMQQTGGGVIVNVGSELGLVGAPDLAAYCASKGGVVQLTRAMAIDHAADGIRINCVCPGPIETPLLERIIASAADPLMERQRSIEKTLMKRLGRPDEVASAILFLASEEASYMTGSVMIVDGGVIAE